MNTSRLIVKKLVAVASVSSIALWSSLANADDHDNHAGAFVGATTNFDAEHTAFTVGLEYERRLPFLSRLFGVGVLGDFVTGSHEELILAPFVSVHPIGGLKAVVAPGIALSDSFNHRAFVMRLGAGYDFHLGRVSLGPAVSVDFIEGHVALVYGAAIGVGF